MLEVRGLDVAYGDYQVLWDVSLDVGAGEIVAVLGPNGSGKSTILKAVIGLCRPRRGGITLDGADLTRLSVHDMVGAGVSMVMERRRLFPTMSVRENVLLGAYHPSARERAAETFAWVESLFPILRERSGQSAGRLSGGEQQMVAIARSLMARPRLLLMDEPYLGLAPKVVHQVNNIIRRINSEGIAVIFNEQNVALSFRLAHRGYLLEGGRMMLTGTGDEMLRSDVVRRVYLGE
ncbi:ABC transporter ATP-binding protein [Terrarubrum flagellatum]|uniref:ABC transporter ATP-binding protein n=1 Tax=Terrirubrum flagellatum TaxID=2895980 RepID=UPI0031453487